MSQITWGTWASREEVTEDVLVPGPVRRLAALLDHGGEHWRAGELPPLAHWLYLLPEARQSYIASDGHEMKGGFLPPIELPRRMWAGSSLAFHGPLKIGRRITRSSKVTSISPKNGSTGPLVFVTVIHDVFADGEFAVREVQDIVYRNPPSEESLAARPPVSDRAPVPDARRVEMNPTALFRFSALTFNAHRIHYDRGYATEVEGYRGLVVHGPFLAMLLVDHFLRAHPGRDIAAFSFKGRGPAFDHEPFDLTLSDDVDGKFALSCVDMTGHKLMTAELTVRI